MLRSDRKLCEEFGKNFPAINIHKSELCFSMGLIIRSQYNDTSYCYILDWVGGLMCGPRFAELFICDVINFYTDQGRSTTKKKKKSDE